MWLTKSDSQEITFSCRELQAVPRLANFPIASKVTTFREHVSFTFASLICPKIVGMRNHSEFWRKGFGLGIDTVVPTIIGAWKNVWGTRVSFRPVGVVSDFVNRGMLWKGKKERQGKMRKSNYHLAMNTLPQNNPLTQYSDWFSTNGLVLNSGGVSRRSW